MLDTNNKLVNKRSVSGVGLNSVEDESEADHWLWGHVSLIKRSIHSLLQQEHPKHTKLRNQHSSGAKNSRLRRDYSDDHEDNEIGVDTNNDDEDDADVDEEDDDIAGSGFYEEATDIYSLKPSRQCKFSSHIISYRWSEISHINSHSFFSSLAIHIHWAVEPRLQRLK